jgi:hypothetical protein
MLDPAALSALDRLQRRSTEAAAAVLVKGLQTTVSKQAAVTVTRGRIGTAPRLRATRPATPGAPPRRVSGKGQRSIRVASDARGVRIEMVGYMAVQEHRGHPFIAASLRRDADEAMRAFQNAWGAP